MKQRLVIMLMLYAILLDFSIKCVLSTSSYIPAVLGGQFSSRLIVLGGVIVIVLAIGPKVRELKPGRKRWIFKADKNA
jgi:hypothetical protein